MQMKDYSLEKLIGSKVYPEVNTQFKNHTGLSLQGFDHIIPFFTESMITLKMIDCLEKIQPETEFAKIARLHQIPIRGLETIDEQLNAINTQPLDGQVKSLIENVMQFDSSKRAMKLMVNIYKQRNIDSLYRFLKAHFTGDSLELNLLINRNRNWVPIIENAIQQQPVFFAVGAGHFGGKDGIIELLRKRGYTLTPENY